MRPWMYWAYHHISAIGKEHLPHDHLYHVTGSLCENNDQFTAWTPRALPEIEEWDILAIHTTWAHGHAMGFNYNEKLRPAEILLQKDGTPRLIRRAETIEDILRTLA
jgi:diaminopimelate decarboxylase